MGGLVVDTHVMVWYLLDPHRLSPAAEFAIDEASREGHTVFLPTISLVEATYLVEKERLAELALGRLFSALSDPTSRFTAMPLDTEIAEAVKQIPRSIAPDMPDRIIAATALHLNVPLVTRDGRLPELPLETIW